MKTGQIMRCISFAMLVVAVIFVGCAVSHPELGTTIYIGSFEFGAREWRFCYKVYVVVMAVLFAGSFFVKDKKRER